MKRLILWWLATCTAAAVTGQPKRALTFDQALEMTMTRNPELEAISYEKETAEKERKAAYGLRLPKASVTGAYIYMGDDMAIDMNAASWKGSATCRTFRRPSCSRHPLCWPRIGR